MATTQQCPDSMRTASQSASYPTLDAPTSLCSSARTSAMRRSLSSSTQANAIALILFWHNVIALEPTSYNIGHQSTTAIGAPIMMSQYSQTTNNPCCLSQSRIKKNRQMVANRVTPRNRSTDVYCAYILPRALLTTIALDGWLYTAGWRPFAKPCIRDSDYEGHHPDARHTAVQSALLEVQNADHDG